jgi:hypothetical protein
MSTVAVSPATSIGHRVSLMPRCPEDQQILGRDRVPDRSGRRCRAWIFSCGRAWCGRLGIVLAVYIADVVAFIGVSYGGAMVSAILLLTGAKWRDRARLAEGMAHTVVVGPPSSSLP